MWEVGSTGGLMVLFCTLFIGLSPGEDLLSELGCTGWKSGCDTI